MPNQKGNNMSVETIQDLFTSELNNPYSAEKQALADAEEFDEDEEDEDEEDDDDIDGDDEEGLEDEDEEEAGV